MSFVCVASIFSGSHDIKSRNFENGCELSQVLWNFQFSGRFRTMHFFIHPVVTGKPNVSSSGSSMLLTWHLHIV